MKLCFLNPEGATAINVTRLRKCGYETSKIICDWVKNVGSLIVLANGTPDDKVLGVLVYHLNGNEVVSIVKPTETKHLGVFSELKPYLDLKVNKIMVLIDQEDMCISELFTQAENKMRETGIILNHKEDKDRARTYECTLSGKSSHIIIVVNGLPEVISDKHNIEDHLTKAAGIRVDGNSKDSWEALSPDERNDVFRKLKDNKKEVEKLFPQQVFGLKFLGD